MNRTLTIAYYTFREAIRNKVLYSIVFFAVILILLSIVLGAASLNQDSRVVQDVGLLVISIFSDLIAIFLGVTMLYNELERKTVYNILSKPISRTSYFLGKYLGMLLTLALQWLLMGLALTAVVHFRGDALSMQFFQALLLILVQCYLVASVALFFSSFSTPYVSGFLALGIWLVGGLVQELESYLPQLENEVLVRVLAWIISIAPDLSIFTLTTQVTYSIEVPWSYVGAALLYGAGYVGIFLVAGLIIFKRRDFI